MAQARNIGLAVVILTAVLAAQHAKRGGSPMKAAKPTVSDRQACAIVKNTLAKAEPRGFKQMHLVPEGVLLDLGKDKTATINWADIASVSMPVARARDYAALEVNTRDKKHYVFFFPPDTPVRAQLDGLMGAVGTLMADADHGVRFVCSDDAKDYDDDLRAFALQTADWRALPTKPPVSDEVYKYRLLAEDALKNQDLNGAIKYYEDGIAAGPTWDQGWYNVALAYAELKDYFDAAECMKHYVTLLPNAPDARAAKDNIILWEAKAGLQ